MSGLLKKTLVAGVAVATLAGAMSTFTSSADARGFYRGGGRGYYGRGFYGRGVGIGIGAGLLAGGLAAGYYGYPYGYGYGYGYPYGYGYGYPGYGVYGYR